MKQNLVFLKDQESSKISKSADKALLGQIEKDDHTRTWGRPCGDSEGARAVGTDIGRVLRAGPQQTQLAQRLLWEYPCNCEENEFTLESLPKREPPVLDGEFHWKILPNVSRIPTDSPGSSKIWEEEGKFSS